MGWLFLTLSLYQMWQGGKEQTRAQRQQLAAMKKMAIDEVRALRQTINAKGDEITYERDKLTALTKEEKRLSRKVSREHTAKAKRLGIKYDKSGLTDIQTQAQQARNDLNKSMTEKTELEAQKRKSDAEKTEYEKTYAEFEQAQATKPNKPWEKPPSDEPTPSPDQGIHVDKDKIINPNVPNGIMPQPGGNKVFKPIIRPSIGRTKGVNNDKV